MLSDTFGRYNPFPPKHILFGGSQAEWEKLGYKSNNTSKIHYNASPADYDAETNTCRICTAKGMQLANRVSSVIIGVVAVALIGTGICLVIVLKKKKAH